jgi:hypothetical protein
MRLLFLSLFVFASLPSASWAGAWTLAAGRGQIITEASYSRARTRFGGGATAFEKKFVKATVEYGISDTVTLFVVPEYVWAAQNDFSAKDYSAGGGARVRLFSDSGVLSLQTSYRRAGAFAATVSDRGDSSREFETRCLYGTNFTLFGIDGFADAEAAWRRISGSRPDEIVGDVSVGLSATVDSKLLVQSFNIVSTGRAVAPYAAYRLHKVAMSTVGRISEHWSLQSGGFISYAGRNVVAERGFFVALWRDF